jgi:hypothetical protein
MPMNLTAEKRLDLISRVYETCYDNTESFYVDNVGGCVAYLLGEIANDGSYVLYAPLDDEEIKQMRWLLETFDKDHDIWKFIDVYSDFNDPDTMTHAEIEAMIEKLDAV